MFNMTSIDELCEVIDKVVKGWVKHEKKMSWNRRSRSKTLEAHLDES